MHRRGDDEQGKEGLTVHPVPTAQVQPYKDLTATLEDFQQLKALHYDDKRQQFLDYGEHSEDVSLQVRSQ
jgi:hypothetical protein